MLSYNNFYDILLIAYLYLFLYNIALTTLIWIILQHSTFTFKTIYSFADFKFNFLALISTTIIFFSIAGIPPFIGFFSKLLILLALVTSNFFFFYMFFFALLFFALYFYLQNIRFLYSPIFTKISYTFLTNLRLPLVFAYTVVTVSFIFIFGLFFFDDFLLYFFWLLN